MSDPPKLVITQKTLAEVRAYLGIPDYMPPNVTVVTDAEAQADMAAQRAGNADEEAILVCCREGEPTPYTDNVKGRCNVCDTPIFWRPHAPKIKRVCMECANALVEEQSE